MSGRILGNNYLKGATILSSNAESGYPAANMVDGRTNRQAAFAVNASPRVVVFDMLSAFNCSAVGVAKHNLASVGASLLVEVSADNSTYSTLIDEAISSDGVLYFEPETSRTGRYVRVSVSGHDDTAYISDITVGDSVSILCGQPVGFVSPYWGYKDQILSNITRGNELAGITVINKPREFKISLSKIAIADEQVFYDVETATKSGPFYFKWAVLDEDGIDGEAAFCWLKNSFFSTRFDSFVTRGATIDCMGFV